jgi:hypothetical protein
MQVREFNDNEDLDTALIPIREPGGEEDPIGATLRIPDRLYTRALQYSAIARAMLHWAAATSIRPKWQSSADGGHHGHPYHVANDRKWQF